MIVSEYSKSFEDFRKGFPVLKQKTYLSVCDKMILHKNVRNSINVFMDHLEMASANRVDHEEKVVGSRRKFAKLLNVDETTIAAIRNVSDGMNSVAWSMPMSEGDNIIFSANSEHPNNIYPWLRLSRRGNEARIIPTKHDGSLDIDAMIEAIDKNTKIVSCASVTFAPGHRTDLEKLGAACQEKDVFLLVDGVQSSGILAHDFSNSPIDGFVTSTSKGLLGLYGYGFLYISPKWIERLEPAYLSRPAVCIGADDHSVMGQVDYDLQPDSRRFEVGSFNLAGAYAADTSINLLLDLGVETIEKHVLELSRTLNEGVSKLGLHCNVPSLGPYQSHIVTFGQLDAGGHGVSSDPRISKISTCLFEANIVHTIRRGQLRFAIHAYNNIEDIEFTIQTINEAMRTL